MNKFSHRSPGYDKFYASLGYCPMLLESNVENGERGRVAKGKDSIEISMEYWSGAVADIWMEDWSGKGFGQQ